MARGYLRSGGLRIHKRMSVSDCLHTCNMYSCTSVHWDIKKRLCYVHTPQEKGGRVVLSPCCMYITRVCRKGVASKMTTPAPLGGTTTLYTRAPPAVEKTTPAPPVKGRPSTTVPPLFGFTKSPASTEATTTMSTSSVAPPTTPTVNGDGKEVTQFTTTMRVTQPPRTKPTTGKPVYKYPQTTSPSIFQTTTIPDTGRCPDPFEKLLMTEVGGGGRKSVAQTVEDCKRVCLLDWTCVALDFDFMKRICTKFTKTPDYTTVQRGNKQCCVHYRRTTCPADGDKGMGEQTKCFQHRAIDLTRKQPGDDSELQHLDSSPTVSCSALCYMEETINFAPEGLTLNERKVVRGCDEYTTGVDNVKCRQKEEVTPNGDTIIKLICHCRWDGCNGLLFSSLKETILYLPMDHAVRDMSELQHSTTTTNVKFENFFHVRGTSACFNGKSDITVKSLKGYPFGALNPLTHERRPRLTIMFWFMRTQAQGLMTLMSNGGDDAPLQILSFPEGLQQRVTAAVELTNNQVYTVTDVAPLNQWIFVGIRMVQRVRSGGGTELQLFLSPDQVKQNKPVDTRRIPSDLIKTSNMPLYIGKSSKSVQTAYPHGEEQKGQHYFTGYMDEVVIFGEALDTNSMLSVIGVLNKL